jgi:catechol 2,3-dioxygenase
MNDSKLPADITLGMVSLTVASLERSTAFYRRSIGLELIAQNGRSVTMGTAGKELVHLVEVPGAVRVPGRTGLYHFALLLPSRQALGSALRNLIATGTRITGGADHLVSEALYLDDPDGNGIEIYRDRPREEWPMRNGRPQMDTLPLDFEGILASASGEGDLSTLPSGTIMGHMHLHVAGINEAVTFYEDVIGFELQLRFGPSAAFLSAGGYHHHLGVNTWAGVGAPPPPAGTVGLRHFVIRLPEDARDELAGRLSASRTPFELRADGLLVQDPSQNSILFV